MVLTPTYFTDNSVGDVLNITPNAFQDLFPGNPFKLSWHGSWDQFFFFKFHLLAESNPWPSGRHVNALASFSMVSLLEPILWYNPKLHYRTGDNTHRLVEPLPFQWQLEERELEDCARLRDKGGFIQGSQIVLWGMALMCWWIVIQKNYTILFYFILHFSDSSSWKCVW